MAEIELAPAAGATRGAGDPWVHRGSPRALLDAGLALLDGLEHDPTPTMRWYRACEPALVLGRGQGQGQSQPELHPPRDVTVVRRFSGGGAVWLDDAMLCADLALPPRHPLLVGDLKAVFLRVGRAWEQALAALGVPDLSVHDGPNTARRRGDAHQRVLAALCYANLGAGEVLAGGRKLVGLSQRRRRHGALVQCGLLRRWRPAGLLTAFGADPADAGVLGAAVGLDDLLDPPPSDGAIAAAVEAALAPGDPSP